MAGRPPFIAALRREAITVGKQVPPIIVMAAVGHPSVASAGADAVLSKPFELTELDAIVEELIATGS